MAKDCAKCVFGIHYTSDGNLTRICHAKNVSDYEAITAINKENCDCYEEGHALYKKYKNGDFKHLTASQRYLIDGKDFSKEPVAICQSFGGRPNRNCWRGEGEYCYCRLGCTAKTELNGSGKLIKEERELLRNAMNGIS